jgi:hydrogenase expression/formation protein HypC
MCLTIPGRIERIEESAPGERVAVVAYGELRRRAHLIYLPEAAVGDFVLVQAGFAMQRVRPEEAEAAIAEYARAMAAVPGTA